MRVFLLTALALWLGTPCVSLPAIPEFVSSSTIEDSGYSSDSETQDSTLVISALSRPLHLGTLYDARKDRIIAGIRLWRTEDIKSKITISPQPNTRFQVEASESLSEKLNLLDVSASVKASFCAGLIEVGGSAEYLTEKTSSTHQCRVTLNYHVTTDLKELIISDLKAPNPVLLANTEATHVVSQVLYGADALMEFQETASDGSSKQEIQGNLHLMINKIPGISFSGDGSLNMTDTDKKKVKNFSCKFYGDLQLTELPTTFEEAVKVYKKLPSLLGEKGEKAVPVKVWLYPLSKFSDTTSKLKRMISETIVSAVEKVMDDFHSAEIRTNDLLERSKEIKAEDIVSKLEQFQSRLRVFTTEFLQKMSDLIPAIREGTMEESSLSELLNSQEASGFSGKDMEQWLHEKETEINVVTMYISKLNSTIKSPGCELSTFLMNPDVTDAFVFSFTSMSYEEPYLKKISQVTKNLTEDVTWDRKTDVQKILLSLPCHIKAILKSKNMTYLNTIWPVAKNPNILTSEREPTEDPWYNRGEVKEALNSALSVYNKIPFESKVISYFPEPNHPGASVQWYHNADLKNPHIADFQNLDLTLDPNTVSKHLVLSEGYVKATYVGELQPYPDNPDRFDPHPQVMSREPLTRSCYWESEWSGSYTAIGVAYRSMDRSKWIKFSDKAWCLECYGSHYVANHNGEETKISIPASDSKRVGVFLDRQSGILSFYRVSSDQHTHLHTFYTTFTHEPLHAVFNINCGIVSLVTMNS